MSNSIACCMNVYNDNWALPGALEAASQWADDIFVIHASPGQKRSTDGTIETLEKWGVRHIFADISVGFGAIRTRLIHESGCDWSLIADADERLYKTVPIFDCEGDEKYPDTKTPNLKTTMINPAFNQMERLRNIIDNECESLDAVCMCRQHWFDFGFKKPAQNWKRVEDWQLRCIKNQAHIGYDPSVKLHERLIDLRSGGEPPFFRGDTGRGPFFMHFHNFFKPMEPDQNKEDMEIYKMLDESRTKGMWLEEAAGLKE